MDALLRSPKWSETVTETRAKKNLHPEFSGPVAMVVRRLEYASLGSLSDQHTGGEKNVWGPCSSSCKHVRSSPATQASASGLLRDSLPSALTTISLTTSYPLFGPVLTAYKNSLCKHLSFL